MFLIQIPEKHFQEVVLRKFSADYENFRKIFSRYQWPLFNFQFEIKVLETKQ